MNICLIRIDDRLIHGQVLVNVVPAYEIKRLVVVNDAVVNTPLRMKMMDLGVPERLNVSYFKADECARRCQTEAGVENAVLLFANPVDALRYVQDGGKVPGPINVGGLHHSPSRQRQVHPVVYVDDADVQAFTALHKIGIALEIRAVPNEPGVPLGQRLPEIMV